MTEPVVLAEYEKLKDEQLLRIGTRDNLIYAMLAAVAAIVVGAMSTDAARPVLLATPIPSFALGWTYLANDRKVREISTYIRAVIQPRFGEGALQWETSHRLSVTRRWAKELQLITDLLAFPIVGISTAVAYCVQVDSVSGWAVAAIIVGGVLSVTLATEMVHYFITDRNEDAALAAL